MRCLVLGGGGFIGSAVVDRLLLDQHTVRIFERPDVKPYRVFTGSEQVGWQGGDLQNVEHINDALDDIDIVFHLVSTTLPKNSNDDPVYDVQSNLVATLRLLIAMAAKGVRRMVFISSGGTVYGPPQYIPIDEKHPTEPKVSYGITKLAIEKYLVMYEALHGIKATILRVANPFGERQRIATAQGAVGVFLHRAMHGETIEIWGDGNVTRDYIYISDVAEAFIKAAEYQGTKNVFNIGSGSGTSLNELLTTMESVLGGPIARQYLPGRAFDVMVNVLDTSLAATELGWRPKVSLPEGITRTVAWTKSSQSNKPQ